MVPVAGQFGRMLQASFGFRVKVLCRDFRGEGLGSFRFGAGVLDVRAFVCFFLGGKQFEAGSDWSFSF